jgi:hypothetical protein
VARISAQELAELVPCPLEEVQRLRDLGLITPHEEDGLVPASDAHVVRLMGAFEESGISLDDVARADESGALSFPLGLFFPEPAFAERSGMRGSYFGMALADELAQVLYALGRYEEAKRLSVSVSPDP